MWGRQSHPSQKIPGHLPLSAIRRVKDGKFYSQEKLPKILICAMGMGSEAGAAVPVPTAGSVDPGQGELVPIRTQSLESSRKERSGPAVVTVRKGWGTVRKGQVHSVPGPQGPSDLGSPACQPPGTVPSPRPPPGQTLGPLTPPSQGPLVDVGSGGGGGGVMP